jgi:hypothetical protein
MRLSLAEFRQLQQKPHKYHAQPVVIDGMRFPSTAEGKFYRYLKTQIAIGIVKYFLRQVPIHLPGGVKLVIDYLVFYTNGVVRYIDVKGVETEMFKAKKKLVEALYPVKIDTVNPKQVNQLLKT